MKNNNLKIGHYADIQAKVRTKNLRTNFQQSLKSIVSIVAMEKLDIAVIAGDIFEYDEPNEDERELIYQHIIELLKIDSLQELVLMLGNHDFDVKGGIANNPISILQSILREVDTDGKLMAKLNYLQKSIPTPSIINDDLVWLPYSLEDHTTSHKLLYRDILFNDDDKMYIGVFHDILFEYVEDKGLPVRNKSRLFKRNDFLCKYIFAGDIHELWNIDGFFYPGSTIQRNHGEGSYIRFTGGDKVKVTKAPHKYVLIHQVNVKSKLIDVTTPHAIKNNLVYCTVDLSTTNTIDVDFIEHNVKQYLDTYDNNIDLIIKIKLSSENQKHRSILISLCSGYSNFEIEIQDIKSIINNNNIDLKNGKLDSYVLSQEKIVDLFKLGLATVDDNTTVFKAVSEDVVSLFQNNLEMIYDAEKSYDIELLDIATNGFQLLGPNKINLDIPGLTRISATNKVGKTTFYLMFNFIRYGKVYSQLKDNTKKYNNSLIFNNKLPDENHVNVTLNTKINGLIVKIQRNVYRNWKETATYQQRASKNNLDYIASIKHELKVEIYDNETNKIKHTILDKNAEVLLDRWFGDSIKNLLIINQHKLTELLNLPTDKLEKLLLEYIGNNFIETMVQNLPMVKEQLLANKPEKDDVTLSAEIIEHENNILIADNDNQERKLNIEKIQTNLSDKHKSLDECNRLAVELGDVPAKIELLDIEINKYQTIIDNHVVVEYEQLPAEFDISEPLKVDNSDKKLELSTLKNKKIEDKSLLIGKNNEIINNLILAFQQSKLKVENEITETINNKINSLHDAHEELTIKINNHQYWIDLNALIDKKESEIFSNQNKLAKLSTQITNNNNRIAANKEQIKNGICSACNQKIGDGVDVDKLNAEIEQLEADNDNIKNDNVSLLDGITEIKNAKSKLQNIRDTKIPEDLLTIDTNTTNEIKDLINQRLETSKESRTLSVGSLIDNGKLLCNDMILKYLDIVDFHNNLTKFKDSRDVNELNTKLLPHFEVYQNNITLINEIDDNVEVLQNHIEELTKAENDYNLKLRDYNNKKSEYLLAVSRVNENNRIITEKNQKYNDALLLIKQPKIDIEKLKTVDLIKHQKLNIEINTLKFDLLEIQKELDINNRLINETENNINNMKDKIRECKEQLIAFQDWNNKKFTFKYYHMMITKVLSKSIFNYYRNSINYKFNELLENVNFDLEWNEDGRLYKIEFDDLTSEKTYTNVIGASGMETCFLGLSLIYSISELNQKHKLSHIFIDEISGQLNSGKDLLDEQSKTNYQEMLILLLSKFTNSKIFIVDHVIKNLFETETYIITKNKNQSFIKLQ